MQRDHHGGPSRPTPTPIFNHRKRQRQAMFADPISNHSNNPSMPTPAQASYPDLMPVGGFQTQGSRQKAQSTSAYGVGSFYTPQKQRSCGANSARVAGGGNRVPSSAPTQSCRSNNYSSNNNNTNNAVRVGWGHQGSQAAVPSKDQRNRIGRGGSNSFSTQSTSINNQPQYQGSHQTARGNYTQQQNRNQNTQGVYDHQPQGGGVWNAERSNCGQSLHQYSQHAAPAGRGGSKGWGGAPPPPNVLLAASPPRPGSLLMNSRGFGQEFTSTHTRSKDVSKASNIKSSRQSGTKGKDQPGLRVLCSSVAMVKRSVLQNDPLGPHLFEMFGVLDSAVVSDKTGTGKEFVLRDETDTIHCIFYEIDRSLPRLIRGQWQRCVGTVEHKSGRLKCVSVRAAGPDEKHLAKLSEHLTEQLMTTGRTTEE
ncbi:spermatogenesis-associated protein 22-like [Haliotis asinina]|uniref:spermatogenesis-associated protein 22-like n=1 Tax=Haliotis asinina TaxID=109174 RepID=UPI003532039D